MTYEVVRGDRYKHYNGNIYTIKLIATHTETMEGLVVYEDENLHIWARPVEMFFGYLKDGRKRYTLIDEDEDEFE